MIVPHYWAEHRLKHRERSRQITVRRIGWSDASQAEAEAHAETRAQEALARILAGEDLNRTDPKTPYNGAEGLPIREEIVERHGDTVITRNSYGARCLNTPNVLFADIDLPDGLPLRWPLTAFALLAAIAVVTARSMGSVGLGIGLMVLAVILAAPLARVFARTAAALTGGPEKTARRHITRFVARHPDWNVRIYRTPAGFRVIATHQTFQPNDEPVTCFFKSPRNRPPLRHHVPQPAMLPRPCQRQTLAHRHPIPPATPAGRVAGGPGKTRAAECVDCRLRRKSAWLRSLCVR